MEERVRLYQKVFGSVFKQRKKQKTKKTQKPWGQKELETYPAFND